MGKRDIYFYCKRICFLETVSEMRPDLDDIQYLSSKAGKGKLRFLDVATNLTKLILASSYVSTSPLVSKNRFRVKYFLNFILQNTPKNLSSKLNFLNK